MRTEPELTVEQGVQTALGDSVQDVDGDCSGRKVGFDGAGLVSDDVHEVGFGSRGWVGVAVVAPIFVSGEDALSEDALRCRQLLEQTLGLAGLQDSGRGPVKQECRTFEELTFRTLAGVRALNFWRPGRTGFTRPPAARYVETRGILFAGAFRCEFGGLTRETCESLGWDGGRGVKMVSKMGESERSSWQVKFDLDGKVGEYTSSQVFLQGKTDNFFSGLVWTDLFKCTILSSLRC